MPVYIRRNVSWSPASLANESFELDDSDFIQDPDQHRDHLPQPYRLINKILVSILDGVWEDVNDRESERIADASRFRPPQYECAVHVEDDASSNLSKSECMAATPDGQNIVVGLPNGLGVVRADTQQIVDLWLEQDLHIVNLEVASLAEDRYLITTIDDMGCGRLYGFARDQLFHLHTVNESESASSKSIVSKCQASSEGDFMGVFLEKPSSQEGWLEIHKLPKESWLKDLDSLVGKAAPKSMSQSNQQLSKAPTPSQEQDLPYHSTHSLDSNHSSHVNTDRNTVAGTVASDEQRSQSPGSHRGERTSHKFNPPSIVMKVLPPGELTGSAFTSVQQASKSLDNSGEVVGTGSNHLLTGQHLEHRLGIFKQLHREEMKYLPEEPQQRIILPHFHFLKPGRIVSQGMESSSTAGQPGSVALWWQNGSQMMLFSLHKQSKDLERKPDVVVPLSTHIITSSISIDGSQVALALANNNLVIWDMYLGMPKGVLHVAEEGHVTQLTFLDPSVCPQDTYEHLPYPMATNYYVMVAMDSGEVYLVNCGHMTHQPKLLDLNIVHQDEVPSLCQPVDGVPDLLLTCRKKGSVYLHDLHHGNQLCEITLPPEYELQSPWQPQICVGAKGRMLYLKGQLRDVEPSPQEEPLSPKAGSVASVADEVPSSKQEDSAQQMEPQVEEDSTLQVEPPKGDDILHVEPLSTRLFVFQLRSFPTLDKYRERERPQIPFVVHSTVNNRVEALFKERICQQGSRVSRMQQRWGQLKDELENIRQMREKNQQKTQRASQLSSGP